LAGVGDQVDAGDFAVSSGEGAGDSWSPAGGSRCTAPTWLLAPRSAEFGFPAERAFPVPVVAGHGLLAGTTFTLVLVTMLAG
jgi:hypothetical protein